MTERVKTPVETVALLKAIIFQDKRERLAAGFRYGSRGLSDRLAETFGLSVRVVHAIKEGERHKNVSPNQQCRGLTVGPERLERIRSYNAKVKRTKPIAVHLQHYWPRNLSRRHRSKA